MKIDLNSDEAVYFDIDSLYRPAIYFKADDRRAGISPRLEKLISDAFNHGVARGKRLRSDEINNLLNDNA